MKTKFIVSLIAILMFSTTTLYFSQHSHAEDAPRRIEIVAKRWDYTPSQITLKKGVPVVIVLTSQDVNHGLKFKELNLVVNVKKGPDERGPIHSYSGRDVHRAVFSILREGTRLNEDGVAGDGVSMRFAPPTAGSILRRVR